MKHFSDENLEEILLSVLLNNLNFNDQHLHKINRKYFSNDMHNQLFNVMQINYEDRTTILSEVTLKGIMEDKKTSAEKIEDYLLLYHRLTERKALEGDALYAIDKLQDLYIKRESEKLVHSTLSILDTEKGSKVLSDFEDILTEIREDSKTIEIVERFVYKNINDRKEAYLEGKAYPEKKKSIPYGFPELDKHTGGMFPGEFYLIVGGPKTGKSRMLFNIAYNNVIIGNTVMYVTIEMPIEQVERMFDSRHSEVSYSNLKFSRLEEAQDTKYLNHIIGEPKLYIVDARIGCKPSTIRQKIKQFKRTHKLDLIIIDYLSIVEPDKVYKSGWEKEIDIAKQFKQMARAENIPLVSAAQLTKEARKGKKVGMEYIANGDVAPHCDLILQLVPVGEDSPDLLEAQVTGNRDGAIFSFLMKTEWDINKMMAPKEDNTPVWTSPGPEPILIPMPDTNVEVEEVKTNETTGENTENKDPK